MVQTLKTYYGFVTSVYVMPRHSRKRKRSNGFKRAAKRFKARRSGKRKSFKRKFSGRAALSIRRPPFFKHLAPRVRTTHVNQITVQLSNLATAYTTSGSIRVTPARLRDPLPAVSDQCFPENFVFMSSLFERYRVVGFKVKVVYLKTTNNENDKFYSCLYTTPNSEGPDDPYGYVTGNTQKIASQPLRDAFLQEANGVRKKFITTSGAGGGAKMKEVTHYFPYTSIATMEHLPKADMVAGNYTGKVTKTGGAVYDPPRTPSLFIRGVGPFEQGYAGGAQNLDVAITIKFYVEWFDQRIELEPSNNDV